MVIWDDPLITFTKNDNLNPFGLLHSFADEIRHMKGLHLISLSWALENEDMQKFKTKYQELSHKFIEASIIILANTEAEAFLLSAHGVKNIIANSTIFVDERIFVCSNEKSHLEFNYRTLINARLTPAKRHELAKYIDAPGLLYSIYGMHEDRIEAENRVRSLLPHACFLNPTLNNGIYRVLTLTEVARLTAMSESALILSAVEGACRASMEALMCGVPIVSTPSIGGRDMFYAQPYAIICDPAPEAVRNAVDELHQRHLDRRMVREHVLRLVDAARRNFLHALHVAFRHELSLTCPIDSVTRFKNANPWAPQRNSAQGQYFLEWINAQKSKSSVSKA